MYPEFRYFSFINLNLRPTPRKKPVSPKFNTNSIPPSKCTCKLYPYYVHFF